MDVGLRVVRGPDWKWGNQDDGEGHVGTVVEIGKPGSATSPDKTVVVQWDSGLRTNYRIGYQGMYDLRIFDNAAIGIKHQNIICDGCKTQGIQGMRWKCTKCHDFDLCTLCYMADKHDLTHSFQRFNTAMSRGVKVTKRKDSVKIQAFGNFAGARVVRGPDWDWGNQDGGEGKIGKVTDVRGWDSESGRSVAAVTWSSGSTNVYRVGHKGKVDLKYVQAASGGNYYHENLPVLGEFNEVEINPTKSNQFKVGDKVRVDLEVDILKMMQEGHGGWNPRMSDYVGKIGTVHRITEHGDVRVQYEGCTNRWTFHPGALRKVQTMSVGDIVKLSENIQEVKDLQKGHGEWNEAMKATLGKTGRVLKVYGDGDLRVAVGNQTWTFNPQCVTLVISSTATDLNNTMGHNERQDLQKRAKYCIELLFQLQFEDNRDNTTKALDYFKLEGSRRYSDILGSTWRFCVFNWFADSLSTLLVQLDELHQTETGPDRLIREAAQGHADVVKEIIGKFPDKVDQKSSGKTALQVSSHQGHKEIVQYLLAAGANLELKDEDGDTALHYSSFGNQADVMELLLQKGAQINALNNGECSTLHVAVNKQHLECVRVLLKHQADVNIQDACGDTALHDAIGKDNFEILDLLVNSMGIDFTLKNKRGFNVLHHAALKGNNYATEKILQKCRQLVDMKKDDGFAPLHLSALNGHKDVTSTLLVTGQANIEIRNNRQQTPLLLAVSQGHGSIIEVLVTKGADLNVEDEDGDTCLHLALMRQSVPGEWDDCPILETIRKQFDVLENVDTMGITIACFLVQHGANLFHKNHENKTALDLISDIKLQDIIKQFSDIKLQDIIKQFSTLNLRSELASGGLDDPMCDLCTEQPRTVTFLPCQHKVVCRECCIKMKKCIECKVLITYKVDQDGTYIIPKDVAERSNIEPQSSTLQRKLNEMEENVLCSICMERKRDMAFLCGHTVCSTCGEELKTCHMCRKPIVKKINLYS